VQQKGILFILAASVLWGTTGTAQALAPEGAQPLAVGALRLLVAGSALLAALLIRQPKSLSWGSFHMPLGPVVVGAACMAAYQVLFFAGVALTGVAVGTIVGIGSSPILAGALGYIFRGERPGWRWGAATILAVLGCSLLALTGQEEVNINPLGMLLAIGAGAAYATFSLVSKRLLETEPVEKVMAVTFGMGAVMLSPLLFTLDLSWAASPRGAAVILHLGIVATALAYTLFGQGLRLVPLAAAVTLSLAEPLTAGTLGVLLLGERLSVPALTGIAMIFAGLVILAIRPGGASRPALHKT
jgi:drug/metabolite transporter, DME family